MTTDLDDFYLEKDEPVRSCLLALREIILKQDTDVVASWKYRMPFFCYKGKMFCYLWVDKKNGQPYMGIVEGKRFDEPFLIPDKRSRMKIMLFDPNADLPIDIIQSILKKALDLYRNGIVLLKTKV